MLDLIADLLPVARRARPRPWPKQVKTRCARGRRISGNPDRHLPGANCGSFVAVYSLDEAQQIGGLKLRNRTVMAPMVTNLAGADGQVSEALLGHYTRRAARGVGLVIVEASVVDREHRLEQRNLGAFHDRQVPGLARLARRIHHGGARALLQLVHAGPKSLAAQQLVGPSPVRVLQGALPRELNVDELEQIRAQFVAAARRAAEAGFDGVELHCGHFYLLGAFLSPYTNRRSDRFGGSTTNRVRLVRQIIREIRARWGALCISCRFNGLENIRRGVEIHEARRIACALEQAGADLLHVSGVLVRSAHSPIPHHRPELNRFSAEEPPALLRGFPFGSHLPCAASIKQVVQLPVVGVGHVRDAVFARDVLRRGLCDLLAVGRGLLADAGFWDKVLRGRDDQIRGCQRCGTCLSRVVQHQPIRCSVNEQLGAE